MNCVELHELLCQIVLIHIYKWNSSLATPSLKQWKSDWDDDIDHVGDDGTADDDGADDTDDNDDDDNVSLGIISKLTWSQLELNSIQCIKLQLN